MPFDSPCLKPLNNNNQKRGYKKEALSGRFCQARVHKAHTHKGPLFFSSTKRKTKMSNSFKPMHFLLG